MPNIPGTDPTAGQGQDQNLETAMGGWGDGERGGGSNPEAPVRPTSPVQPAAPVQPQVPGQPSVVPQGDAPAALVTPVTPVLDQNAIVNAAVAATLAANRASQPQAPQQQVPAMTTEQLYAHYGVQTVNAETMQKIMAADPAQGAAVLNQILQQNMIATVKMVQDLTKSDIGQLKGEFAPDVKAWRDWQSQQRETQATERFYKQYPQLATETDLVKETLDALSARVARKEITFADEASAFKAVADSVGRILARVGGGTQPNGGQQPPAPTQQPARRPAVLANQGRGGSQQNNAAPSTIDRVVESW